MGLLGVLEDRSRWSFQTLHIKEADTIRADREARKSSQTIPNKRIARQDDVDW